MTKVEKKKAKAAKILDRYGDPALDRLTRQVIAETGVMELSLAYTDYVVNKHHEDTETKFAIVCWIMAAVFALLILWDVRFAFPACVMFVNAIYYELLARMRHMQAEHSKHTVMIAALGIVEPEEEEEEDEE